MKIGIFGGAFNPVHNGHLALAQQYKKELNLDKIIYIPTANPPHKTSSGLIAGEDRIAMLKLVVGNDEISDIEFNRQGKSYTYLTLQELKEVYPNDELFLIIGSDQFYYFENWYEFEGIMELATVVTGAREENEYQNMLEYKKEHKSLEKVIISSFDVVEISSSKIRDMIKNGEDISSVVPTAVTEYIKEHKLYV